MAFGKGSKHRKKMGEFQSSELSNPSKTLLANIRFASVDRPVKTITVTSSDIDEGKTAVASNLACAIASSGRSVLVVETDMRRRCLAHLLEVRPKFGLYSVLVGEAQLKDAVVSTTLENLYFLDTESGMVSPPDLLGTKRFEMLVDVLRKSFDYVIFDTPPLGTFVDAAIVAHVTDGTLLVVRQGKTKRRSVHQSIAQLKAAESNIMGLVLTFSKQEENYYYYTYYNEEGKRITRNRGGRRAAAASPAQEEAQGAVVAVPAPPDDAQGIGFNDEDAITAAVMSDLNDVDLDSWSEFAQEGMVSFRTTTDEEDAQGGDEELSAAVASVSGKHARAEALAIEAAAQEKRRQALAEAEAIRAKYQKALEKLSALNAAADAAAEVAEAPAEADAAEAAQAAEAEEAAAEDAAGAENAEEAENTETAEHAELVETIDEHEAENAENVKTSQTAEAEEAATEDAAAEHSASATKTSTRREKRKRRRGQQ